MPNVSDVNDQYILQLKASLDYNNLSWYQKPFFPTALESALRSYDKRHPSSLLNVRDAYLNYTWFFQRWIFPGLFAFYKTPLAQEFGTAAEFLEWITDVRLKFATLPASVTKVDLSKNDLNDKPCDQLVEVLSELPVGVTSVDLSGNHLGKMKVDKLAIVFAALPVSVTSVNLSWNCFNHYTTYELKIAFAALPKGLTSINLTSNGYLFNFAQIFSVLPKDLTSINLSDIGFSRKSGDAIVEAIAVLSRRLTSIDLSYNCLYNKNSHKLAAIFRALPEGLISINLSANRLGLKSGAELAEALEALPNGLRSLDLSKNEFSLMEDDELAIALAAIPKSLTSLNLSSNGFFISRFVASLAAIPASVTSLDLGSNGFGWGSVAELTVFFAAFSANITSLDLSKGHQFGVISLDTLKQLAGKLPHIKSLRISCETIMQMEPEKGRALKEIFSGIARFEDIILVPSLDAQKCLRHLRIIPSCKKMSAFFVEKAIKNGDLLASEAKASPLDVQTYLDTYHPPTSNTLKI